MNVYVSCIGNFEIKHYVPTLKSCSLPINNSEKSSINMCICASLNFVNSSRYIFIVEVYEIETLQFLVKGRAKWHLLSAMNFVDN